MEKAKEVLELIASIEAKRAEQSRLLRTLAMWAKVSEQGIDPETVATFSYKDEYTSKEALRDLLKEHRILYRTDHAIYNFHRLLSRHYHNVLTLKTGEKVKLDPMIKRPERD